jgi:hypothetical protein
LYISTKTACWFKLSSSAAAMTSPLVITVLLLFFFNMAYAQESNNAADGKLVSSDTQIALGKYVGLGYWLFEDETASFDLYLINNSNETIKEIKVIPSALTTDKDGRPTFSLAPSYIGSSNVIIKPREATENGIDLAPGEKQRISYIIDQTVIDNIQYNAATYVGQLIFFTENVEPTSISVTVSFQVDDTRLYLVFVAIGIGSAIAIGFFLTRWEKRKEIENMTKDDTDVISHINGHIRSINALRNTINRDAWNNIRQAYNEKRIAIEKYRDQIDLDDSAESVKWFELVDEQIRQANLMLENEEHSDNQELPEIEKPEGNEYEALKENVIKQQVDEQRKSDRKNWKKYVYLASVGIIASLVTVIAEPQFPGWTPLSIGAAIAIGFGAYRLQDVLKILPRKEEA